MDFQTRRNATRRPASRQLSFYKSRQVTIQRHLVAVAFLAVLLPISAADGFRRPIGLSTAVTIDFLADRRQSSAESARDVTETLANSDHLFNTKPFFTRQMFFLVSHLPILTDPSYLKVRKGCWFFFNKIEF